MRTYRAATCPATLGSVNPPRVLLAYDGSEGADVALAAVARLRWPAGTRIQVLAVHDAPLRFLHPLADQLVFVELEEAVVRATQRMRADLSGDVLVERSVVRGHALTALLAQAERFGAQLLVVGSRNRGPLRATVFGSVGRELVAHAVWPVLVARSELLDRVLLAHDGSDASRAAVRLVGSSPIFADASVKMFSVRCASSADATIQILTAAALEESNLIVLGTATAHGLDRLLHGDVADDLVTRARCSLLVVPATVRTASQMATRVLTR
jgi:nucleotide-binding universal stress UspA family protein